MEGKRLERRGKGCWRFEVRDEGYLRGSGVTCFAPFVGHVTGSSGRDTIFMHLHASKKKLGQNFVSTFSLDVDSARLRFGGGCVDCGSWSRDWSGRRVFAE